MGSRIIFEDDIIENNTKIPEKITIKEANENSQENDDFTETNHMINSIILGSKNSELTGNVILLGSRVPKRNEIPIECMGNGSNSQSESSMKESNSQSKSNMKESKPKEKRRLRTELEMLGVDIKEDKDDLDDNYDVFGDDSKIFKKYKLRKTEQTISYKEPEDIKPTLHNKIKETCPDCKQKFESRVSLFNHLRTHNKTIHGFTCSQCNKKFDKNTELVAHKESHTNGTFLCNDCKLAFSNHRDYLLHCYDHLDKPHFKCPECNLHYPKGVYKVHITMHFPDTISCDLCSFVTKNEKNLKIHLNQHRDRFTCVECGKVMKNKEMYKYHMSVHTGVKKIQCLYCGACFRTSTARQVHTRIHTGEKPFNCDLCGYKARQSTDLKRHKEKHGGKKYTCDDCGKKFYNKFYLTTHIRTHMKQSMYECPECNAQFNSVAGLRTHSLYKHTTERPIECTVCEKKFINYNQYRKHCRAKYHLRNIYGLNNADK